MANEAASVLESVGGLPLATAVLGDLAIGDVGRRRSAALVRGEGLGSGRRGAESGHLALNNIGTAKTIARYPEGMEELEEGYEMSADIHSSHDQIRAAVNISWARSITATWRPPSCGPLGPSSIDREIASFDAYVTEELALIDEMRGNWAGRSEGLLRARHSG